MPSPRLPIPPPLRGTEPNSFAAHTIIDRLPHIASRVSTDNPLPAPMAARLEALMAEMPHQPIQPLGDDPGAPDLALWQGYITPYLAHDWLQVPWFFAETYFYRRIIALVEFFQTGFDPFAVQKRQSLDTTLEPCRALAAQAQALCEAGWHVDNLHRLLMLALWGNQADMSLWAPDDTTQPHYADAESQQTHLLVDDAAAVATYLSRAPSPRRVDLMLDNAGFELVGDLCLIDYLLSTGHIQQVRVHLKLHPTFVSDATPSDVQSTIAFLAAAPDAALQSLGARLSAYLASGRLHLQSHAFWTSPLPLWHLPENLRQDLAAATLVISKGDAHYRRALGDAHWPFTTPITDVVSYFPAPLVFLRTCKAEVMAGLATAQVQEVAQRDPTWLVNGKWGVIQCVQGAAAVFT